MKVICLGTGTSTGVPLLGCGCEVCRSGKKENERLRSSILIQLQKNGAQSTLGDTSVANILIDTGPDLRLQCLREQIRRIDAVLYTHAHADHIFGIDDLRAFNFVTGKSIPLYADKQTGARLRAIFSYAFAADEAYQGGAAPRLDLHTIEAYAPFDLFGVEFLPLLLKHGRADVLGFRVNKFAYLTDCSSIPERTKEQLQGLEVLILDGLRERPHPTHFNTAAALIEVEELKPRKTYLTHLTHELDHERGNHALKQMTSHDVELAYDGLQFEVL